MLAAARLVLWVEVLARAFWRPAVLFFALVALGLFGLPASVAGIPALILLVAAVAGLVVLGLRGFARPEVADAERAAGAGWRDFSPAVRGVARPAGRGRRG